MSKQRLEQIGNKIVIYGLREDYQREVFQRPFNPQGSPNPDGEPSNSTEVTDYYSSRKKASRELSRLKRKLRRELGECALRPSSELQFERNLVRQSYRGDYDLIVMTHSIVRVQFGKGKIITNKNNQATYKGKIIH